MANKEKVSDLLNNKNIQAKIINSFNEYLRFTEGLLKEGLTFEKRVTKFSKTSAAIYLPKRLIGRTFRVMLIPLDEPYELSETVKPVKAPDMKEAEKILKDTEKDLKRIQAPETNESSVPDRKRLLDIGI